MKDRIKMYHTSPNKIENGTIHNHDEEIIKDFSQLSINKQNEGFNMKVKDLNDFQQEQFEDIFYFKVDFEDRVDGNPNPWGCPWYWDDEIILKGDCIEEMVENFIKEYENEWKREQLIEEVE